ncbi:hypothetical protein CARN8_820016 [mine drainage metagenome]|uniref:Uncharacterized protein n=1 Tax=mine drainage metagenome TaxID=410659 RepID=E6PTB2_9ZZZZ
MGFFRLNGAKFPLHSHSIPIGVFTIVFGSVPLTCWLYNRSPFAPKVTHASPRLSAAGRITSEAQPTAAPTARR